MNLGLGRRAGLVVVAALVAVVFAAPGSAAPGDACARFAPGTVAGHVKNPRLTEISGLVASRRHPGLYWTHNDSGGNPEVFALALDGTDRGSYALSGATAVDWEAIAIGPKAGAAGSYIYAADIGDNAAEAPLNGLGTARPFVSVFRVAEPSVTPAAPGAPLTGVERFDLDYPAGREDSEALFVDPVSGDLVIVTKSPLGMSRILVAPAAAMVHGARITMQDFGVIQIVPAVGAVSTFPGTFVTGADISADGSLILLRTYQAVLAFTRAPGQSVADALHGSPCSAPQSQEGQGESVAIATDMSRYATISEGVGQAINVFTVTGAPAPTTTTTTAPTHVAGEVLARTGRNSDAVLWSAVALVVAVLVLRFKARPRARGSE